MGFFYSTSDLDGSVVVLCVCVRVRACMHIKLFFVDLVEL